MTDEIIIDEIDAYCVETGHKPSTVCVRALGDSRLYDRLLKRGPKMEEKLGKLRAYMAANPARAKAQSGEAA